MSILFSVYKIIQEALFPLSLIEKELLSISPKDALSKFNPAPDYSGLAVALPTAKSIFAYKDERVTKLVWQIKYKRSETSLKIGGYALWHGLKSHLRITPTSQTIVIPIPISDKRRRERGYNQCELLLDEIEKLAELELNNLDKSEQYLSKNISFEKNLLIRIQHNMSQTLKGRRDRLKNSKDIFALNEKAIENYRVEKFNDYSIVIIDDVITTGSTMYQAMETLKKAGFRNVSALSLAH